MTTLVRAELKCGVCGRVDEYHTLGSVIHDGSAPDLDLRPNGTLSVLPLQIMECKHCGYCAPDITQASAMARRVVQTDKYTELRRRPLPEHVGRYLRSLVIAKAEGNELLAAQSCHHAAWIAERGHPELARQLRSNAAMHYSCVPGGELEGRRGLLEVVMADLHRRNGDFASVYRICTQGLNKLPTTLDKKALLLERSLALKNDTDRHTWAEVETAD